MHAKPQIAIPEPTSFDPEYNQRGWPQYARAVELAGGIPVPVPLHVPQAAVAKLVANCSAILLPGSGADIDPQKYGQERNPESHPPDPTREAVDDLLLQDAFNLRKPILGICYGLQSMNVWKNGSIHQHIDGSGVNHRPGREVQEAHPIVLEADSNLAGIVGAAGLKVNSSHHQAVDLPGDALTIAARSEQDGIVEAVEGSMEDQFVLGVQWHPERTYEAHASSRAIFKAFVEAAARWRLRPPVESAAEPVKV